MGRKAQHAKFIALQPCRTTCVMYHLHMLAMLTAIDFDYQTSRQANEIRKIGTQWKLTTKAQAIDLFAS